MTLERITAHAAVAATALTVTGWVIYIAVGGIAA